MKFSGRVLLPLSTQFDSLLFSLLPGRFVSLVEAAVPVGLWLSGSAGTRPSLIRFFCFIRRFWNQIFTWNIHKIFHFSLRWRCREIYLSLVELKSVGYFNSSRSREVLVEVEFLLQLRQLLIREICPSCVVVVVHQQRIGTLRSGWEALKTNKNNIIKRY